MNAQLIRLASEVGQFLSEKRAMLAVAESCTGGGICQVLTEIPGSSQWFDCGVVCYSNASKIKQLGVNPQTLASFGAVSAETALEMTAGILQNSGADYAIAVTGIAGPGGGSVEKPVGTVFIAVQNGQNARCDEQHFRGNRGEIRLQVIEFALKNLLKI